MCQKSKVGRTCKGNKCMTEMRKTHKTSVVITEGKKNNFEKFRVGEGIILKLDLQKSWSL
jgi:hypothetical protein